MSHHDTAAQITTEVMKAAPPIAVSSLHFFGVELSQWVLLLTLIYTVIQIVLALEKRFRRRKEEQDEDRP